MEPNTEDLSEDGWKWWPVQRVTTDPFGLYQEVLRNHWWAINDRGEVLMHRSRDGRLSPQCNTNKIVIERLMRRYSELDGLVVGFMKIPVAFTPLRIEDYR